MKCVVTTLAVLIALTSQPASAQENSTGGLVFDIDANTMKIWLDCMGGKDSSQVIAACTTFLDSAWGKDIVVDRVKALNQRAWAYAQVGDVDRSIADSDQAVQLAPSNYSAILFRGYGYLLKKDFNQAIADLSRAIQLDPQVFWAFSWRGLAYYYQADFDRAVMDYSEAIRLNPKDVSTWISRGDSYLQNGDIDRSIADYDQAIRLEPTNTRAISNRQIAYSKKASVEGSSGATFSCSSEQVKGQIAAIAKDQIRNSGAGMFFVDAENSVIEISSIRTRYKDNNQVHCAAHVAYKFAPSPMFGNNSGSGNLWAGALGRQANGEITYMVEKTDNGELYVTVRGLPRL